MALLRKFNCFSQDLAEAKHNLSLHVIRAMFTNSLPQATDTSVDTTGAVCQLLPSGALELSEGYGYVKQGPVVIVASVERTGGRYVLRFENIIFTPTGGNIGPMRYVVLYNDSSGIASARPAIGWFDLGASLTAADGNNVAIDWSDSGVITIE